MTGILYDMPLFRPPSEGNNLIIQATLGCSFNKCTFCSMYKSKNYTARPLEAVFADINEAARNWPGASRVFLADGDAMALPTDHLLEILGYLAKSLPELTRVSCYALPKNLMQKSVAELEKLKASRLSLIYYGIESGSADIQRRVHKGATPDFMAQGLTRAKQAGIKTSCTVILGLGGKNRWQDHIEGTAELNNRVEPTYLSTLQLMLDEAGRLDFLENFGEPFDFQDDGGILIELEDLVSRLNPERPVIFRSNHASNALPLAGTLPRDKEKLLGAIAAAKADALQLRPAATRAL